MSKKEVTIDSLTSYYEALLALVPGNLYWKDTNGVLQGCNNNLAKLLGLNSPKEIVHKNDYDIASKVEAEAIRKIDFEVMSHKQEQVNEERYTLPNGSQIWYLTQRSPVLDEQGEVVGLIGISFDITDRKKMEDDLRIAKEKAEAANKTKSDFISNMEHDLRTPFSGIRGVANVLQGLCEDKYPELTQWTDIMIKSCAQWEDVQNRIFNVLAAEQTKIVQIEPTSISHELTKIKDMQAATLLLRKLSLEIEPIAENIDSINTDPLRLHLILLSIISNAINFTEQGEIRIKVLHERGYCVIQVSDTGIGIPADKLEYIFEKYTKLERSNTFGSNFKGLGLGLYVAREYAKQIGAEIQVESTIGEGSTFSIKLPLQLHA